MSAPRVLSVGQCSYDGGQIERFLSREFGAEVLTADFASEAIEAIRSSTIDLVLVNRVADRDGAPGIDLIRAMKADAKLANVPVILVSNLADAQEEAVALGACPGFGKAELNSSKAVEAVAAVLSAQDRVEG